MVEQINSSSKQSKQSKAKTWNYESTVEQVETIIEQIETGELSLAEVFDRYAEAIKYLNQCDTFLQKRQQQVDLLVETLTADSDF